ncbi:hypothetical protein COCCADRAFT_39169 [Bipolaris zeicola 26-R-13]|uniref:Uncharacterized protein n=1 Tax=Cochliobolus carbonum (strain 26-R-13) TaxID=930089 RepID=W6YH13_COCC2|nr:uncharacterized protein COCCADRAFT_39169 [Bipolaris zeicola 26-R-13]EUC30636.1 hypothetical protein COCCADRAFT_39169 [Bipolaris zeicola 26-R-13]
MAGPLSLLSGAPVIIIRKEGADRPPCLSLRADHARPQTAAVIVYKVRQLRQSLTRSRLSHYSQSEVRDTPSTLPKASNVSRTKLCANRARALRIILPPRHWFISCLPPTAFVPAQYDNKQKKRNK